MSTISPVEDHFTGSETERDRGKACAWTWAREVPDGATHLIDLTKPALTLTASKAANFGVWHARSTAHR